MKTKKIYTKEKFRAYEVTEKKYVVVGPCEHGHDVVWLETTLEHVAEAFTVIISELEKDRKKCQNVKKKVNKKGSKK